MKKKTTRLWALLLALFMVLPLAQASAQKADALVVASTTGMSGEFMSGMWGNNTTDIDIRILLHDYPTVVWGLDEKAAVNEMVIQNFDRQLDGKGNTVFTFTLKEGLRFSDGSAITAKDYVFSILLESSPLIRAMGGTNANRDYLMGSATYVSGETPYFSGVRLLDRNRFSLIVNQDYLPYFYDLTFGHVLPFPAAVIAPGCEVRDDGEGAYIKGEFTTQLLESTILDPATGYMSHPRVVSGAYKLVSYNKEARTAEFEANPFFLGNRERQKPAIKRLLVREIKNAEISSALQNGEVHLVNKISSADSIDAVRALPNNAVHNKAYPRTGFAYLSFSVERELTSSQLLRAAITQMVDREAITQNFLRGYGQAVYAYYGLGQWMARQMGNGLKDFDKHPYDLAQAKNLLEQDGWTLNSDGTAYDPQVGGLRHKQIGDQIKPLNLRMGITNDNQAAELVIENLNASLGQLGGQLEVNYLSMSDLLRQYYRQDARTFDLLFLASNFGYVFDPYYSYHTGEDYQVILNTSGLLDGQLFALTKSLRETTPGDKRTFLNRWVAFQKHWTDVLPLLPLYSNTYYDGYNAKLTNYHPERYFSWADAILYAQFE